jgi:hypothetical protein
MIATNLILSRHFIKINACLIGYGLWIALSQHQMITTTFSIPVCIYNDQADTKIIAPDHVTITVSCTRKLLHQFDVQQSAIHVDASFLQEGNNKIILQKQNLFLPDAISLVNLIPSQIQIQLQRAE